MKFKNGQYFTKNIQLKQCVLDFIKNKPKCILEPSCGRGDLVDFVQSNIDTKFDLYELDESIELLETINRNDINYGDFLIQNIETKYITIIGNPPYLKTKSGNLYIKFIEKCFNLLESNGELVFIVPSDVFKVTACNKLINKMMNCGTFTHIYKPNNERLFENASIDVVVFRYCNNPDLPKKVYYNNHYKFILNSNGVLSFTNEPNTNLKKIGDYFDVFVGFVSGKESILKNEKFGNIKILNKEHQENKYILIDKFPSSNKELNKYMISNKEDLKKRKIRKFDNDNWFEFGLLRNKTHIDENVGKDCIYIYNLTRNKKVAFKGKVQYFGGSLLCLIPKTSIDLNNVLNTLNSDEFINEHTYSGRFKISQNQLTNYMI
ncbi:putative adenine specific DNA methyltransferase [Aureococcus anophagefferens virus]|uniref:site-specific DNA-methyltransferase (adenine-specific) n=1 Tax=Aureococcus anophagefferens virus TaxID=1474867 RepID=A0A076FHD3_9VIRU|nr:putative adenine specific DNA methyltransferase [Aureococcus anophagefferens virus]AII17177.1 putative adenine specific DNA methyltransferase [Aureococcus anophagefferens virus]UOG94412.1 DNA modification [Aureococcus anophagefferens virus]